MTAAYGGVPQYAASTLPIQFFVPGGTLVRVYLTGYGWQDWGYSRDGIQVTMRPMISPIYVDSMGGTEGRPGEKQFFGYYGNLRLELVQFNLETCRVVDNMVNNVNPGSNPTWSDAGNTSAPVVTAPVSLISPGTLMYANKMFFAISLVDANDPHTFWCCVPNGEGRTLNLGSRYQTRVYSFDCEPDPSPIGTTSCAAPSGVVTAGLTFSKIGMTLAPSTAVTSAPTTGM
jgi:hypothetical protein